MIREAALIIVSCVLFVQMGLSDTISGILRIRFRILSCPKCTTFWAILAWSLSHGHCVLDSVAASFISSYCALWLALLYDTLATLYNKLYEQISYSPGSTEASGVGKAPGPDALP